MPSQFIAFNSASPTTAAQAKVATGTSIKTLLQVATPSTKSITIIEWGISFDGSSAATPIQVELLQTDVAATVTALTPTILGSDTTASLCAGGTALTGFTASAEGSTTATRVFDAQLVAPTNQYWKQFPLGREPIVPVSRFLRIRVTAGTGVNATCYISWEE